MMSFSRDKIIRVLFFISWFILAFLFIERVRWIFSNHNVTDIGEFLSITGILDFLLVFVLVFLINIRIKMAKKR